MGLKTYIVKRVINAFILLLAAMTVNFMIFVMMPGDPIAAYTLSLEGKLSQEDVAQLKKLYGLDQSLLERYLLYMSNMLTWNFGKTYYTGEPIAKEINFRIWNTLIMMGTAAVLSIFIGTLLGTYLAYKRATKIDAVGVTAALSLSSLPVFWIGWLILITFGYTLRWFPPGGLFPREWVGNPPTDFLTILLGRLNCLVLPVLTLVILTMDGWTLLARACVMETLTEDFVVTARAKGLPERTVLTKHVLKPASLPLVTAAALTFAGLFGGAIITETIYGYPGMGYWIWQAILSKDLYIMYCVFYISALLVIIANLLVDFIYGLIDPRIKVGR